MIPRERIPLTPFDPTIATTQESMIENPMIAKTRRWRLFGFWSVFLFLGLLVLVGCTQPQPAVSASALSEGSAGGTEAIAETEAAQPTAASVDMTPAAESSAVTPSDAPADVVVDGPASAPDSGDAGTDSASQTNTGTAADELRPLDRTVNILVLGSDRRPRMPNWRTDVIMIIAMDLEKGEAGVISIPRDVYLDEIPNHQPNRINVVDYLGEQDEPDGGGPKLLASIITEKTGIPIHHYLRFDFNSFKQVVDALGGVELPVDCPVSEYLPEEDLALRLQPGTYRLTGSQALVYVRSRRQGGDLERARRQQRFTWAVRNQILQENMLPRIPALYAALQDAIQTDVGLVSAIRYVRFALALNEDDVHGMVLAPPDMMHEGWRRGMFVFVADWDLIRERAQTVFERPPLIETNTVGENGDRVRCP